MPADAKHLCELCGEPMPEGESAFKYHGYSGPCPKPPLPADKPLPGPERKLMQALAHMVEASEMPRGQQPAERDDVALPRTAVLTILSAWNTRAHDPRIEQLEAQCALLRTALEDVAEGKGAFSYDRLEHAMNTVENMKATALAALATDAGSRAAAVIAAARELVKGMPYTMGEPGDGQHNALRDAVDKLDAGGRDAD